MATILRSRTLGNRTKAHPHLIKVAQILSLASRSKDLSSQLLVPFLFAEIFFFSLWDLQSTVELIGRILYIISPAIKRMQIPNYVWVSLHQPYPGYTRNLWVFLTGGTYNQGTSSLCHNVQCHVPMERLPGVFILRLGSAGPKCQIQGQLFHQYSLGLSKPVREIFWGHLG